jgi:hypothetical protein
LLTIGDGDRLDLDQAAGGQRLHSHQGVGWVVIPEKLHPGLFDDWQALVTPVTDDRYLGDLVRPGTGCSECTAQVGKYLASLDSQVTGTYQVAAFVFRFLAGDETSLLPVAATTWVYVRGVGRASLGSSGSRCAPSTGCFTSLAGALRYEGVHLSLQRLASIRLQNGQGN